MRTRDPNVWFPAKKFGLGWGLPVTWQGWLVFGVYAAGIVAGALYLADKFRPGEFIALVAALTAALVAICWWKGEPLRWRWGDE
jgi:hypothetical protein